MAAKKPAIAMNIVRVMEQFDTDSECRAILENLRWPQGVRCPRCQSEKVYRANPRKQFDCAGCGYQFSVLSGTTFHDTHLPLPKWFIAVYLMTESKKGISANQMKRTLGISYKTAWYLCHRIRAAMKDSNPLPLRGIIEVDETYVGGKARGKGRGYVGNKTMVLGAIQRGEDIRLAVEKRNDRKTLHTFIKSHVSDEAEAIYTDEWPAYVGIADENTRHETVNHNQEEWVRGDVHTNGVEGVWSLLKRSIVGSYHHLSADHLPAYLDEMTFRFNNRNNPYLFRDTLIRLIQAESLPYQNLIAG